MDLDLKIIEERFIKYAKVNTRSDENSFSVPSTPNQVDFTLKLAAELESVGFSDITYNPKNAFLTASIPSTVSYPTETVGFIAHVDTADFNAENIQPQVHRQYDGKDILLNKEKNIVMRVSEFPQLTNYIGETMITTDGTTLLGADDKAGITSIVTLGEYLINHPEIEHGEIKVAFGPDEEIGARGAKLFDVESFNADFAYTIDSGRRGNLTYENFNASQANVTIQGTAVHPGAAKDTMINALLVASKLATSLPKDEVPEKTDGLDGFYFLMKQDGNIDQVKQSYYIRDHDFDIFKKRIAYFQQKVREINEELGEERVTVEIVNQYRNMRDVIAEKPYIVDIAKRAYRKAGIEPNSVPMRGGTDGAILSHKGLPTPNLFSGSENTHGPFEFVTVESMVLSIHVLLNIAREVAVLQQDKYA